MTKAEEIMEQEEVKKEEVVEAAEGSDNNDQNHNCEAEAPSMEDLMEALLQRLDEILRDLEKNPNLGQSKGVGR